jgi:hypothetical protein
MDLTMRSAVVADQELLMGATRDNLNSVSARFTLHDVATRPEFRRYY